MEEFNRKKCVLAKQKAHVKGLKRSDSVAFCL